jgi:hypothetical protein
MVSSYGVGDSPDIAKQLKVAGRLVRGSAGLRSPARRRLQTGIPWEYLPQEMDCGSG